MMILIIIIIMMMMMIVIIINDDDDNKDVCHRYGESAAGRNWWLAADSRHCVSL